MFALIISFILIFFASSIFDTWTKYRSEVGRIKSQQELNRIIDERLKKLIEAEEASLKATDTMSKRLIQPYKKSPISYKWGINCLKFI